MKICPSELKDYPVVCRGTEAADSKAWEYRQKAKHDIASTVNPATEFEPDSSSSKSHSTLPARQIKRNRTRRSFVQLYRSASGDGCDSILTPFHLLPG